MALIVQLDSNGTERIDFLDLRKRLLDEQRTFDASNLCLVPYSQLPLCAMANAGAARCSLALIREEKNYRRQRFLDRQLATSAARYLRAEEMLPDVRQELERADAVSWGSLSPIQRVWHKLTCLYHHMDSPGDRLRDVEGLFFRTADSNFMTLPTAAYFIDMTVGFILNPPRQESAEKFHAAIGGCAEAVIRHMPLESRNVCSRELVYDYRCTSDCFQPKLGN